VSLLRPKVKSEVEYLRETIDAERQEHRAIIADKDRMIADLAGRIAALADPIGMSRVDQVKALTERALRPKEPPAEGDQKKRVVPKTHNPSLLGRALPDRPGPADNLTFPGSGDWTPGEDEAQPKETAS